MQLNQISVRPILKQEEPKYQESLIMAIEFLGTGDQSSTDSATQGTY